MKIVHAAMPDPIASTEQADSQHDKDAGADEHFEGMDLANHAATAIFSASRASANSAASMASTILSRSPAAKLRLPEPSSSHALRHPSQSRAIFSSTVT